MMDSVHNLLLNSDQLNEHHDLDVLILSTTLKDVSTGLESLSSFLGRIQKEGTTHSSKTLIDTGDSFISKPFIFWTSVIPGFSELDLNEVLKCIRKDAFKSWAERTTACVYTFQYDEAQGYRVDEMSNENKSIMLILQPVHLHTQTGLLSSKDECHLMERKQQCAALLKRASFSTRGKVFGRKLYAMRPALRTNLCWIGFVIVFCVLTYTIHVSVEETKSLNFSGLRHSFEYTDPSFSLSVWTRDQYHDPGDWALRYDDQALIPKSRMTNEEAKYQHWFEKRYPAQTSVVNDQMFLDDNRLRSNESLVYADGQFHIAHCLLAVRRYWMARETGTYVCGFELEYGHIKHCLDSLDKVAFPEESGGPRDFVPLRWNTKVCY